MYGQQTSGFYLSFIYLAKINVQRACFVMKLGATTTKMGKNSRGIVEFGHLLRRFNMKRGKCAKNKSATLDIVSDTLFVGEFWKGVINSKYMWPSLTLLCVTKAGRVGRRAHVRTNLINMESVRTVMQRKWGGVRTYPTIWAA